MITRNDWDDALDAWVEEERERLGGPPSPREIAGYLRGELSTAERARVRALLVYYPELTPLLDEPRRRVRWVHAYAIAATLLVALLLVGPWRDSEPSVPTSRHELTTLRARGPAPEYELPAGGQLYQIVAVPSAPPDEDEHRIDIVRDGEVLWSGSSIRPLEDTFTVNIPGRFLKPGTYVLNIRRHGRLVDSYTFHVVPR